MYDAVKWLCFSSFFFFFFFSFLVCNLDSLVNQFAKLLSATPVQVLSLIIGPERRALEAQLAGLGKDEASEECFIQTALEDLKVILFMSCTGHM